MRQRGPLPLPKVPAASALAFLGTAHVSKGSSLLPRNDRGRRQSLPSLCHGPTATSTVFVGCLPVSADHQAAIAQVNARIEPDEKEVSSVPTAKGAAGCGKNVRAIGAPRMIEEIGLGKTLAMNDPSRGQCYQPVRQVASLPGQRLLFERAAAEHDDCQLTLRGARFLFDPGHGLPGAKETVQKILWDVR